MSLTKSIDFLRLLRENNNRDWMHSHKAMYQEAKEEFFDFVSNLLPSLIELDENLTGLEVKKCIFRINRDVRFSKDKSPYKNNFGAFMVEGGKQSGKAGYYFHLEPGDNSFLAGGVYGPSSENLAKIRQEIDYNPGDLQKITRESSFVKYFGAIQGDSLKRPPKGYSADHPNIDLLKLKSFLVMHPKKDKEVLNEKFLEKAVGIFKEIQPLNEYLNVAMS